MRPTGVDRNAFAAAFLDRPRLCLEVVKQLSDLLERRPVTPVSARVAFFDDDGPSGRDKNYEPNSFDGPVQTNEEHYKGLPATGVSGHYPQVPREVDDFKQAGDLYRLQPKDAQQRLVDNIAGSLAQVSREDIIERSVGHFTKADAEFGRRIAEGIAARRKAPAGTAQGH